MPRLQYRLTIPKKVLVLRIIIAALQNPKNSGLYGSRFFFIRSITTWIVCYQSNYFPFLKLFLSKKVLVVRRLFADETDFEIGRFCSPLHNRQWAGMADFAPKSRQLYCAFCLDLAFIGSSPL